MALMNMLLVDVLMVELEVGVVKAKPRVDL